MELKALDLMRKRLNYGGGIPQQDRMIKDKRWSLDHAVLYSYQAAKISHADTTGEVVKALINPNKLKQDYDDKILSVGFEYNFKPGDVFEWLNTGTKWLIYLQDLTELAYFRGDIRKCSYEIQWKDENGNIQKTYGAIRGPVETKINFIQKNGISVDEPNHSINMLIPKNEYTLKYFRRYAKFYLQSLADGDQSICWRVEGFDSISMPGVLEITAVEYYANEDEDDIENGIVDGLIIKPFPPEPSDATIAGEVFIKPKKTYTYTYLGELKPIWDFDKSLPLEYEINGNTINIKWTKTYIGQFVLKCGNSEKTIVVESLF